MANVSDLKVVGANGRALRSIRWGLRLAAAALVLCGSAVSAALIEVPGTALESNRGHAAGNPSYARSLRAFAGESTSTPASAFARPVVATSPIPDGWNGEPLQGRPVAAERLLSQSGGDLFAALDAPYLLDAPPASLSEQSATDLWIVFVVIAGLVGYQIRRKSKFGAIRVRPGRP